MNAPAATTQPELGVPHHRFRVDPFLRQFGWHARQPEERLRKSLDDCPDPDYRTAQHDLQAAIHLRRALREAAAARREASGKVDLDPAATRTAAANLTAIGDAASRLSPHAARLCLGPAMTPEHLRSLSSLRDPARQIDPSRHRGDRVTDLYRGAEHAISVCLDCLERPDALDPLHRRAARERMRTTLANHLKHAPALQRQRLADAISKATSPPSHGNELEGAVQFLGILLNAAQGPMQTARALAVAGSHPVRAIARRAARGRTRRLAGAATGTAVPWLLRLSAFAGDRDSAEPGEGRNRLPRTALPSEADASAHLSAEQLHRTTMTLRAARQFALALADAPEHIPAGLPGFRQAWIQPAAPRRRLQQLLYGKPAQPGDLLTRGAGAASLHPDTDRATSAAIELDSATAARWAEWNAGNTGESRLADPEWVLESINSLPSPERDALLAKHPSAEPRQCAANAARDPESRKTLLAYHDRQRCAAKLTMAAAAVRSASRIAVIHARLTAASRHLHRIPAAERGKFRTAPTGSPQADNAAVMKDIHAFGSTPADPADLVGHLHQRWQELDESRKRAYAALPLPEAAHPDLPMQSPGEDEEFQLDLARPEHRRWMHALSAWLSDAADRIRERPATPLDHLRNLHATRIAPYTTGQRHVPEPAAAEKARSSAARGI